MDRPKLPDFKSPPVTEVALTVQFEMLSDLRAIHLGQLWEEFRKDRFPTVEEHPPVPRTIERLRANSTVAMPQFEILNMPPLPRFLFVSAAGTEVIQVQQDRFTFNWRKRSPSDAYPRYEPLEAKFLHYAGVFTDFLKREGIGRMKVNQAEVTYLNQVPPIQVGDRIEKVISILSGKFTNQHINEPEQISLTLTFPVKRDAGGPPLGRLYVDVSSTQSDAPAMTLKLTARGRPEGTDIKAAIDLFRICRAAIVNGFASITSKEMHKAWGRIDDDEPGRYSVRGSLPSTGTQVDA